MAHYAVLDENNIVIQVFVGVDENEIQDGISDWETFYGAKRTSYNTIGGIHLYGGKPFRKNYAGIGFKYDEERDAFIPPKPFESWILNEDTCLWEPPTAYPEDGQSYYWNEDSKSWDIVVDQG